MSEALEENLRKSVYGFYTKEDYQKRREELETSEKLLKLRKESLKDDDTEPEKKKEKKKDKKRKAAKPASLSFGDELDEEGEPSPSLLTKKKSLKSTDVDTSFLKKNEHESAQESARQEQLLREYLAKEQQEKEKLFDLSVVFRNEQTQTEFKEQYLNSKITLKKGETVEACLVKLRQQLIQELNSKLAKSKCWVSPSLIMISEKFIMPEAMNFYQINGIRWIEGEPMFPVVSGPSGPVGVTVTERTWYEKNRHIFPYSHWDLYDPEAKYSKAKAIANRDRSTGGMAFDTDLEMKQRVKV